MVSHHTSPTDERSVTLPFANGMEPRLALIRARIEEVVATSVTAEEAAENLWNFIHTTMYRPLAFTNKPFIAMCVAMSMLMERRELDLNKQFDSAPNSPASNNSAAQCSGNCALCSSKSHSDCPR